MCTEDMLTIGSDCCTIKLLRSRACLILCLPYFCFNFYQNPNKIALKVKQIIIKDFQFGNSIRHGWSLVMHEQESVCVQNQFQFRKVFKMQVSTLSHPRCFDNSLCLCNISDYYIHKEIKLCCTTDDNDVQMYAFMVLKIFILQMLEEHSFINFILLSYLQSEKIFNKIQKKRLLLTQHS